METQWLEDYVSLAETRRFSRSVQLRHVARGSVIAEDSWQKLNRLGLGLVAMLVVLFLWHITWIAVKELIGSYAQKQLSAFFLSSVLPRPA